MSKTLVTDLPHYKNVLNDDPDVDFTVSIWKDSAGENICAMCNDPSCGEPRPAHAEVPTIFYGDDFNSECYCDHHYAWLTGEGGDSTLHLLKDKVDYEEIVRQAEEAFWAVIASRFPSIKSGDVDPGMAMVLPEAMQEAVESWVSMNGPNEETFFEAARTMEIKTEADAKRFIHMAIAAGIGFNPDDGFEGLVTYATGDRLFTPEEAQILDDQLAEARGLLKDPCEVANDFDGVGSDSPSAS